MKPNNDFQPLTAAINTWGFLRSSRKNKVIKEHAVRIHSPVTIEVGDIEMEESASESIEPIVENGNVVGLIYNCSCGNHSEIRFEYDKEENLPEPESDSDSDT